MTSLSRRSFLSAGAAVFAVSAVAACGNDSGGQTAGGGAGGDGVETPQINVGVFPSFNGLPAEVAQESGAFTDNGLEVTLSTFATPAEATPQLLGGQIHFALMDMTVPILGKSKGVPLVMVAPAASGKIPEHEGPIGFVNLWVAGDSQFSDVKSLENATIAVPQINSQIWLDVREAIDKAGGDSSKVKFMEAPNTIAALKAGQADCTTTAEPGGTAVLNDSTIKPLSPLEVAGGATAYAFVTTMQFAQQNPNTVEAFKAAILAANKTANSDKAVAVSAAGNLLDAPPEVLEKAIFPTYVETELVAGDIETAIERMERYGMLPDTVPQPADLLLAQ